MFFLILSLSALLPYCGCCRLVQGLTAFSFATDAARGLTPGRLVYSKRKQASERKSRFEAKPRGRQPDGWAWSKRQTWMEEKRESYVRTWRVRRFCSWCSFDSSSHWVVACLLLVNKEQRKTGLLAAKWSSTLTYLPPPPPVSAAAQRTRRDAGKCSTLAFLCCHRDPLCSCYRYRCCQSRCSRESKGEFRRRTRRKENSLAHQLSLLIHVIELHTAEHLTECYWKGEEWLGRIQWDERTTDRPVDGLNSGNRSQWARWWRRRRSNTLWHCAFIEKRIGDAKWPPSVGRSWTERRAGQRNRWRRANILNTTRVVCFSRG